MRTHLREFSRRYSSRLDGEDIHQCHERRSPSLCFLHHHQVVGRNVTTGASSTNRNTLNSQIEHEGHHLSQSTRSDGERDHLEQQRTYRTHPPTSNGALAPTTTTPAQQNHPTAGVMRLPPITAHLLPTAKAHANHRDWRQQSAMNQVQ